MATTVAENAHHRVESSGEDSRLSTPPPNSPSDPGTPSEQIANDSAFHQNQSSGSIHINPPSYGGPTHLGQPAGLEKPPRKKPGRKPKPKDPDAPPDDGPKKRTRKPKDPNAPPLRRRRKGESAEVSSVQSGNGGPPNAEIQPRPSSDFRLPPEPQRGNHADIKERPLHSFFAPAPPPSNPTQQPVRTSGQNYDPIRSNYDPVRETVITHVHQSPYLNPQGSPSQLHHPTNRASASPSISSLVDPPNHALTSPSIAAQSFFNQQQQARHREEGHNSMPPSPSVNKPASSTAIESPIMKAPPPAPIPAPKKPEVVAPVPGPSTISKKPVGPSTTTSSAAASPKPPKQKDANTLFPTPPPLPGSGLMQLGGGGPGEGTEFRAPTVILNIPMNGEINKYINFTRLAEEQYGWDALHPRLAAQRERLARVAAAGAALERNGSGRDSGDDMSLDSEGEGDASNVEMGGMSDGKVGTDGGAEGGAKKVPRKRRMKEDEYDKDDGFVDDTELLWEEQAAAANDGFFVYSGPLVPEGEKPTTELRADGAPKRGRGRGSRGGRLPGAGTTRVRTVSGQNPGQEGRPATGPGSRGGTTVRKPRITKADRARREQEKAEREKMGAMAMQPNGYGGGMALASAASMGSTPMVFNQG